ncbi:CDP-alcohol phosphatidyltransferase family protein, partial [Xanthomonas oryzae pv. oryzae]
MVSIHALTGRFQALLRPMVGALSRGGITANQVRLIAAAVSLMVATVVLRGGPSWPLLYLLLPVWMLVRMALNAVEGMLAREFGQQSRLGAYLNETLR